MSPMRRLASAFALAAALHAFVVGPAAAKVSYFSIDVGRSRQRSRRAREARQPA